MKLKGYLIPSKDCIFVVNKDSKGNFLEDPIEYKFNMENIDVELNDLFQVKELKDGTKVIDETLGYYKK